LLSQLDKIQLMFNMAHFVFFFFLGNDTGRGIKGKGREKRRQYSREEKVMVILRHLEGKGKVWRGS